MAKGYLLPRLVEAKARRRRVLAFMKKRVMPEMRRYGVIVISMRPMAIIAYSKWRLHEYPLAGDLVIQGFRGAKYNPLYAALAFLRCASSLNGNRRNLAKCHACEASCGQIGGSRNDNSNEDHSASGPRAPALSRMRRRACDNVAPEMRPSPS